MLTLTGDVGCKQAVKRPVLPDNDNDVADGSGGGGIGRGSRGTACRVWSEKDKKKEKDHGGEEMVVTGNRFLSERHSVAFLIVHPFKAVDEWFVFLLCAPVLDPY